MITLPSYLIQPEGSANLYAYWRRDVLLCDLATHKDESPRIFRVVNQVGRTLFERVSVDEIREEGKTHRCHRPWCFKTVSDDVIAPWGGFYCSVGCMEADQERVTRQILREEGEANC